MAYLDGMFSSFEFCLPTKGINVPEGLHWLDEVKYDGYRVRLERDGARVRLISKGRVKLDRPISVDRRGRPQDPAKALRARR
jgi:hypothetical protein